MDKSSDYSRLSGAVKSLQEEVHFLKMEVASLRDAFRYSTAPEPSPAEPETLEFLKEEFSCKKCGASRDQDADFCDQCSSPVKETRGTQPSVPKPTPVAPKVPAIDWEQFMGVKMFAWIGGFAMFLGGLFFVKYTIDQNLISPAVRVILGFMTGLGAIIGGLRMRRQGYATTVEALCASGVAILYADIYASRTFYNFIPTELAFLLMILVTGVSFLLAVRLDSRYVAVLGLIGGFLTPILLSTGVDRPIALFSYIAILDVGLIAVALRKEWGFLTPMSAAATLLMEASWTVKFFAVDKAVLAAGIALVFCVIFLIAREISERLNLEKPHFQLPASMVPLISLAFCVNMLNHASLGRSPWLVLTFLWLLNAQFAYMALRRGDMRRPYIVGSLVSFLILFSWTSNYLSPDLLLWGLGFFMGFAILHAVLPIILERLRPEAGSWDWGYMSPLGMLFLIAMGMHTLPALTFIIWPFVLLIGLVAITSAWLADVIWAAGLAVIMVASTFLVWFDRIPNVEGLPGILVVLGLFTLVLFAWGLFIGRGWPKGLKQASAEPEAGPGGLEASHLPALAAFTPFILLAVACVKLPLKDPSQIFGFMLLLNVLLLGLVRHRGLGALSVVALASTFYVEAAWHQTHFAAAAFGGPLAWYSLFYLAFGLFPFIFMRRGSSLWPWIASAFSGLLHFFLIYKAVSKGIGEAYIGLLPLVFAAPSLAGLLWILGNVPADDSGRDFKLALFGGIVLFFITLAIPLQFKNEWLTVGWALEGAALIWLFGRVPHQGLKAAGVTLLVMAFVRLTLNPAVFSYYPRTGQVILNWFLFVYGTAAASLFYAARRLPQGEREILGFDARGILNAMGIALAFLLLNIEVADFFSAGSTITFNFSGSLGQDMTYSIAWALFGAALLGIGINRSASNARLASLALLSVTILKVFFHDLWRLGQLYRVASMVGLAVVLILVSFLYQRYLSDEKKTS